MEWRAGKLYLSDIQHTVPGLLRQSSCFSRICAVDEVRRDPVRVDQRVHGAAVVITGPETCPRIHLIPPGCLLPELHATMLNMRSPSDSTKIYDPLRCIDLTDMLKQNLAGQRDVPQQRPCVSLPWLWPHAPALHCGVPCSCQSALSDRQPCPCTQPPWWPAGILHQHVSTQFCVEQLLCALVSPVGTGPADHSVQAGMQQAWSNAPSSTIYLLMEIDGRKPTEA